ncbi:RnfABCDGE type electron transport complex subunit C [Catenovulum agarivorans DS-2]|uniref:Ion-translocating oxidoreductase complex subunit C n=1 Tax=Catenovulum agarivorans DS-2 TaxID=1328313 RepID=W7QT57_9ALTE|nr:electron transport complex subunit RsxC [Catenovulum agarivorans]EWH11058.1 RnfABCDGE type electron transport complex subunit C [Catenovulum agarivorans DS-2]
MESLIEKIKSGYLWDFPGGVHPPERKSLSNEQAIGKLPLPELLYVTTKQHIGKAAHLIVQKGDKVKAGQTLCAVQGPMELPIHAPTSGEVVDIKSHPIAHASGLSAETIVIKPDGLDTWVEKQPTANYHELTKVELVDKLKSAGIAGLGGAAFPTYVKHSNSQPVEVLIINGVECEPYITADDRLMREYAAEIVSGVEIFTHLLHPKAVVIAIENNKPEAIAAIEKACEGKTQFHVRAIPTKYPAGGEKQLIQVVTGLEVPTGGIPSDIGVVTQNVGTAYAAYKAVVHGEPLTERVVTVTGEQVSKPGNYWVKLGTPVEFVLAQAGYQAARPEHLIMGGPMMGFNIPNKQMPVSKITNCILAPSTSELPLPEDEQNCIRCGYCVDVCPANLLPQQLYWHTKAKEYEKAQEYKLIDCIECGACAYVCPSEIPLVQYYRVAKADIKTQQIEHEKAEKAKERFNARNERLEKEKQARLDKHKQAAQARKAAMEKDQGAKDKVAEALARVQAKKKQTDSAAQPEPASQNDAKSKAQAAIERAKARKAEQAKAQQSEAEPAEPAQAEQPANDAKAKAQAAIARAKARKAEQAKTQQSASTDTPPTQTDKPEAALDKDARIKAAIAKAKAKRKQLGEDQ